MQSFTFYCPTKILFGAGRETEVGQQIRAFGGSHVLVVYGGRSAEKSGLLARIEESLCAAQLPYEKLGGVQPNPRLELVRQGIRLAQDTGCDFVLGVGGGSVMDSAKAIAHGASNPNKDVWEDLWIKKTPLTHTYPIGAVLTISAAGSETSDSAVLTNDETHEKRGYNSDLQRPKFAVMNPELTYTLPAYQVCCGVVDIMMHTLERYFTPVRANSMTDEIAEGLLRNVIRAGRVAAHDSHDYNAMSELMWAGSLSHNGLTELGRGKDFSVHQLGHEVSAKYDAAHGATLSALWASWARYCVDTDAARFVRYGEKVWGLAPTGDTAADALRAIETTENYFRYLSMPTSLPQLLGHTPDEAELEDLTVRCTFGGTRTVGAFRKLGHEDILAIYRMACR